MLWAVRAGRSREEYPPRRCPQQVSAGSQPPLLRPRRSQHTFGAHVIGESKKCLLPLPPGDIQTRLDGGAIMLKETEAEATIENCRALINQITVGLSAEKPFVNVSSAAELLVQLESEASALQSDKFRATPTLTWH